jgi:hypothetical protein
MVDWFRRFGDIPNITFEGAPPVDPKRLRGYGVVPEIQGHDFDGKRRETLWWPENGGGTSASPAHGRAFGDSRDVTAAKLLKNVFEGLELPGEPSDYHFLLQGCATELWKRRREEPDVLDEVEKLCKLDIQLVQARPDAVTDQYGEEPKFYSILTFGILMDLYQREGFLTEALEVAELAAHYGQGDKGRIDLLERVAAVEIEDSA